MYIGASCVLNMTNCKICGIKGIHNFPCQTLKLINRQSNTYDLRWGGYKSTLNVGEVNLNEKDATIYICNFVIFSEYRRNGFATRMLKEIAEVAKQKNCTKLKLMVLQDNIPAISLYEKNGFHFTCSKNKYLVYEKDVI